VSIFEKPNSYMIHRVAGVLVVVGVHTTRVRLDGPQEAAAKVLGGQVAFVGATRLRETGAAIAEGMNAAAMAAAAGCSTAGGCDGECAGECADGAGPAASEAASPAAAMAELRERFGHYFDAINDVDGWVRAVRRGDDPA